ncbi:rod shape-determining protein MreD [bacterium]|nr:rod shape-determining protein MreD [bacterium]
MKRFLFWISTFILVVTIQFSFLWRISFLGVIPNILLILIIWFSFLKGSYKGQIMGFVTGIVADSFSIGIFGANALLFTGIGFFVGLLKKKVDEDNILVQILLVFIITLFYCFGFWMLTKIFGEGKEIILGKTLLFLPLYNGLLAPLCFVMFIRWAKLWREEMYVAD